MSRTSSTISASNFQKFCIVKYCGFTRKNGIGQNHVSNIVRAKKSLIGLDLKSNNFEHKPNFISKQSRLLDTATTTTTCLRSKKSTNSLSFYFLVPFMISFSMSYMLCPIVSALLKQFASSEHCWMQMNMIQ